MICNPNKTDLVAAEEVESIGNGFVARYYNALVGKPDASALRHFYNDRSKYVYVQPGRPDCVMEGLLIIGRFLKRMQYGKCAVTVRSVVTTRRTNPTEFTVSSVCEMSRPGNTVPRTFTQSSVIKRVPWTAADFQIVGTEFRFDDDTVDSSIPIAVGGIPKGSCAISTGTSGEPLVNPVVDSGKKSAKNPKVILVDRHYSKLNGEKPTTTTLTRAGARVLNGNPRGQSSPRRTENKLARGTATVSNEKVTAKPTITMTRPVAKNALKDKSTKPEAQTTVNKTVDVEGRKDLNKVKRTTSVRPALRNRRTFVSYNRYGYLAVMDEDCPSDVQEGPVHLLSASEQEAPNEANGRSKKPRRNRKKNGSKCNNGGVVAP